MKPKTILLSLLLFRSIVADDIKIKKMDNGLVKIQYNQKETTISQSEFDDEYPDPIIKFTDSDSGTNIFSRDGKFIRKSKYYHNRYKYYSSLNKMDSLISACLNRWGFKCGYIDDNDNIIIPMDFERSPPFQNNLAVIGKARKQALIKSNGDFVIGFKCDEIHYHSINLFFCGVEKDSQNMNAKEYTMYLNQKETEIKFQDVRSCSEDLCPVKVKGLWGYLNQFGEFAIPPKFDAFDYIYSDDYLSFNGNYAKFLLKDDSKYAIINKKGEILSKNKFEYVSEINNELTCVCLKKQECGFVNQRFEFSIKPIYASCRNFSEGYAAVQSNNKETKYWKYIDKTGKDVLPAAFLLALEFKNGLAQVWFGYDPWDHVKAYINKNGRILHAELQIVKD